MTPEEREAAARELQRTLFRWRAREYGRWLAARLPWAALALVVLYLAAYVVRVASDL